jgi:hypothetical protein
LQGGTSIDVNNRALVTPFGAISAWHEFSGASTASAVLSGVGIPLTTTQIGTFYQASAGVSVQVLNTGLLGFIRSDFRWGDVQGWSLLGGGRYTFQ